MQLWFKSSSFCKFKSGTYILDNYTDQDGLERFQSILTILYVDSLADRSERFGTVPIYLYIQVYKQIRTVWNGSDLSTKSCMQTILQVDRNGLERFRSIFTPKFMNRSERFGAVPIYSYIQYIQAYKQIRTVWNGFDLFVNPVQYKDV